MSKDTWKMYTIAVSIYQYLHKKDKDIQNDMEHVAPLGERCNFTYYSKMLDLGWLVLESHCCNNRLVNIKIVMSDKRVPIRFIASTLDFTEKNHSNLIDYLALRKLSDKFWPVFISDVDNFLLWFAWDIHASFFPRGQTSDYQRKHPGLSR